MAAPDSAAAESPPHLPPYIQHPACTQLRCSTSMSTPGTHSRPSCQTRWQLPDQPAPCRCSPAPKPNSGNSGRRTSRQRPVGRSAHAARRRSVVYCIFIAIMQYEDEGLLQLLHIMHGTILPTAGRARCVHPSIPLMDGVYVAQNLRKSSLPRKFVLTRVPSPSRISPTVVPANDDMRTR